MSCCKILGSKKCKRKCSDATSYCWQHCPSHSPSRPKVSSPRSSRKSSKKFPDKYGSVDTPKSVSFSNKLNVRYIPRRNPNELGGIAWAEDITELQGICVSSVLDVYSTWDRDTFEKRKYSPEAKQLVDSCLSIMENKKVSREDRLEIIKFAEKRERKRNEYIRERIRGYEVF